MSNRKVLFLGKRNDSHSMKAREFLELYFDNPTILLGDWKDSPPKKLLEWKGDYIISYLSRWILTPEMINSASVAAINFHPASPDYPGIGCINFALYQNEERYGVTCHHMSEKVDSGSIISTKSFPIFEKDTVETLLSRTYDFQLVLFYEMMDKIINDENLPKSKEVWTRKPTTREEFNALTEIKPDMSEKEIREINRATNFDGWSKKPK